MKIVGPRDIRIINLTTYISMKVIVLLLILAFVFILTGNVFGFIYVLVLQIIMGAGVRYAFEFFKIPTVYIIDWKYKQPGQDDKSVWIAHKLLFEYIYKHLILRQ